MKKMYAALLILTLTIGGCGVKTVQEEVNEKYINSKGTIHAYPLDETSEYLSESIGLYMEYLVVVKDEKSFESQYEKLKEYFLVEQDNEMFLRWILYPETSVNALIDDVRIITALNKASKLFNNPEYSKAAEKLEITILKTQKSDGFIVDYYDWSLQLPGERITLSYLIEDYLITNKTNKLLENVDQTETFFPEYYDVKEHSYMKNKEVHLIDQLLIAINRQDIGLRSTIFEKWIINEWKTNGVVFGRYNRETEKASVTYESLSVYYYLNLYFNKINEAVLASEVIDHANKIATTSTLEKAHFFDYIQYQLLVENEKIANRMEN